MAVSWETEVESHLAQTSLLQTEHRRNVLSPSATALARGSAHGGPSKDPCYGGSHDTAAIQICTVGLRRSHPTHSPPGPLLSPLQDTSHEGCHPPGHQPRPAGEHCMSGLNLTSLYPVPFSTPLEPPNLAYLHV